MANKDWGPDTLARFRYQAEVTLPYCLAVLASEHGILAVLPEHLEDIALKTTSGYRFLQVKTRDPERGLWTASALLVRRSGALRSLYRTYLLTKGEDHSLEIVLEGAIKNNDPLRTLDPGRDRTPLVDLVARELTPDCATAADFVGRLALNESTPPRSSIQDTNTSLLHKLAPNLSRPELEDIHASLLNEIENAMRSTRLGPLWPRSLVHPSRRTSLTEERIRAKTLDANRLSGLTEALSASGRPLLRRFVQSGSRPLTRLVQKLMAGGAPRALIDRARNLEANARHHRAVRMSQRVTDDTATFTDLRERLLVHAQTATALHAGSPAPAATMWNHLLEHFSAHADAIDRNNVFRSDPMLLMGETCILADECAFDWGATSDASQ